MISWLPAANAASSCQPNSPCWPSLDEWNRFNQTVSGRLRVTQMLASSCFPSSPNFDAKTCSDINQNYHNGTFRQETYGALEITQWEACGAANCYPDSQGQSCSLGRLSALYVDAETPADVTATVKFIKQHGIRLVVRNTGHDYLGRSAAANTLALRTYKMKKLDYHASFTPKGSATPSENVGVMGAGVNAQEAVEYFGSHGMSVTTGGCSSVGIAGGFGQGGGHGPLAPTYGLMVDQAIEFDVVTMDGVFRTINQQNDADLFWAMRGGGGQSYAILINYKFQLHPQTQWATWRLEASLTSGSSNISQNTVLRDILTSLANSQEAWSRGRVAGYDVVSASEVTFLQILPGGNDPLATLKNLTAEFNTFVSSHPQVNVSMNSYSLYADEGGFYTGQADYLARSGGVGVSILNPSRLITDENFSSSGAIDALITGILDGMETARSRLGDALSAQVAFLLLSTAPYNTPDASGLTSANPNWRKTLWHLISAAVWVPGVQDGVSAQIAAAGRAALDVIKKPLPVQAAYLNEADPAEPDWESVFFGANYDKLLRVKQRWDPDTLLNCKKCVGYLGPQDPMYSCDSDKPIPSKPFPFK